MYVCMYVCVHESMDGCTVRMDVGVYVRCSACTYVRIQSYIVSHLHICIRRDALKVTTKFTRMGFLLTTGPSCNARGSRV